MEFTNILKSLSSFFKSTPFTKKSSVPLKILILSPHPDDESITSSLALRLALENGSQIKNVAVTLGSNKARQSERLNELAKACKVLGIKNECLSEAWDKKEKELKKIILKYRPQLIICPHLKDFHPTHIKTTKLCIKVLGSLKKYSAIIAWSEFWAPMNKPNLLVEVPQDILNLQMKALAKHKGEIKRNPYHLRLPAWMMDNVRRGSEIIGGTGANAVDMSFGVLYKIELVRNGLFSSIKLPHAVTSNGSDLGQMFKLILEAASLSKTKVK